MEIINETLRATQSAPNSLTNATMEASERGEDLYGPYDSISDLMEALNDPAAHSNR